MQNKKKSKLIHEIRMLMVNTLWSVCAQCIAVVNEMETTI